MLMFIEKGIRGRLAQCSLRHVKANNRYMGDYDSNNPVTYLMYYDVNSMNAWAMSYFLPYGGLKWIEDINILKWNAANDGPI